VSTYNPNHADVTIKKIEGEIFYPVGGTQIIGHVETRPFDVPSGAIGDTIAVVSLNMPRWV
jgi:hypothetical protein